MLGAMILIGIVLPLMLVLLLFLGARLSLLLSLCLHLCLHLLSLCRLSMTLCGSRRLALLVLGPVVSAVIIMPFYHYTPPFDIYRPGYIHFILII
jgi:hypothetical protein